MAAYRKQVPVADSYSVLPVPAVPHLRLPGFLPLPAFLPPWWRPKTTWLAQETDEC